MDVLAGEQHEVHIAFSSHANEVAGCEIDGYRIPEKFHQHGDTSMQVPFVSGSAKFEAMVVCPCSMGTVGRIAHGYSDSAITRAAGTEYEKVRYVGRPAFTATFT